MENGNLSRALLHLVLPQVCAHCREDLPRDAPAPLCLACRPRLAPNERPFCERCAEGSLGQTTHCARCAGRLFHCELVRAAFRYEGAAVSLVHAFKFRGRRDAARSAGAWMGHALPRFPELGRPDALVPVPLHPARRRERGYNQAKLIAEGLAEAAGGGTAGDGTGRVRVEDLLLRQKETRPLWALAREERRRALEGAIACPDPSRVKGRRLWIVDDVCTSGASLEACARALLEAGAAFVAGYVFARQAQPLVQ